MAKRDRGFRDAVKRANKKGKKIDRKVNNKGTLEELQKIADEIYFQQIALNNKKNETNTMKEKYGGYKAELVESRPKVKRNKERTR